METYQEQLNFQLFQDQPKLFATYNLEPLCIFQERKSQFSFRDQFDMPTYDLLNHLPQKQIFQNKGNFPSFHSTQEDSCSQILMKLKQIEKQKKNQTKNIPKNYGKAIISYIIKSKKSLSKILSVYHLNNQEFMIFLKQKSKNINTISDLRSLWNNDEYGKPLRILSYQFMRKHSLSYIFKSRIKNHMTHIKYREKIMEGIKNPNSFNNIKDY